MGFQTPKCGGKMLQSKNCTVVKRACLTVRFLAIFKYIFSTWSLPYLISNFLNMCCPSVHLLCPSGVCVFVCEGSSRVLSPEQVGDAACVLWEGHNQAGLNPTGQSYGSVRRTIWLCHDSYSSNLIVER